MTTSLAEASSPLLVELHEALSQLDRRMRGRRSDDLKPRIDAVRSQLAELTENSESTLASRLELLAHALAEPPGEGRRAAWLAFRARVQPHYEAVVHDLRAEKVDVPSLRPTNYARNALHVASSMTGLIALEVAPTPMIPVAIALGFTIVGWSMEIGRRRSEAINAFCMKLFGKTAHPHEAHRINSATWYASALAVIAIANHVPAAVVALLVLGLGDPAAAIIGRRYGRTKLIHGRTLEGTLAFIAVGALASFAWLAALHPEIGPVRAIVAALLGATAGGIAELTSRRLDDNLTVPLVAFGVALAAFAA